MTGDGKHARVRYECVGSHPWQRRQMSVRSSMKVVEEWVQASAVTMYCVDFLI